MFTEILVLTITLIVIVFIKFNKTASKTSAPGPCFFEGIRPLLKSFKDNTLHILGENLAKQYGDIVQVNAGFCKIVFINEAELVRRLVCAPEFKDITCPLETLEALRLFVLLISFVFAYL